jgi:hypothetical protein
MTVVSAQRAYPKAVFVAMHPGWVQTDMGGDNAPITPEQSVTAMRRTIEGLGSTHKASFVNYDGRRFKGW